MDRIIKNGIIGATGIVIASGALAQDSKEGKLDLSGNMGIESRILETELPIAGFHNKAILEAKSTLDLSDSFIFEAGGRAEGSESDIHPRLSDNLEVYVNRLGLRYHNDRDNFEAFIGTFSDKFFGWQESTLPRNGMYGSFAKSIKGLGKLIIEGQAHMGQYMMAEASLPFYGISAKTISKAGEGKLITGLNLKDFQGDDFTLVNGLIKYNRKAGKGLVDLTVCGFVNLDQDEENFGYVTKLTYASGKTEFGLLHPNIGNNSAPKGFAPHYTPQVNFHGGGAFVKQEIGKNLSIEAGAYKVLIKRTDKSIFKGELKLAYKLD